MSLASQLKNFVFILPTVTCWCASAHPFFFFFWYTWQAFMGWDLGVECLVGPTQTKRGFYHHNHYKIQTPFIVLRISNLMTFLKLIINMLMCCFRTFKQAIQSFFIFDCVKLLKLQFTKKIYNWKIMKKKLNWAIRVFLFFPWIVSWISFILITLTHSYLVI